MNRREFVQTASFAAAGILSLPSFLAASKANFSLGLQLYTLRDIIRKDPKEVLKKVASMGYKEIEAYGYGDGKIFDMPYQEFSQFVKSLGMKVVSGHYGMSVVRGNWSQAVADAKAAGQSYMIVPYLDEKERTSIEDYKKICGDLNKAGEVCNDQGIRFGYHNHAFEFNPIDGTIPYDLMLQELDPKKATMEMDIYWVVNAGHDPHKYFEKYPGRFEQWHVKDMDKTDKSKNADVGTGSINFKSLFAKAKQSGLKHFYVEQESYPVDPLQSAQASATYMKNIL